jgi:hypothetical protein
MSQYNAASSSPALEWQPHGDVRVNVNVNMGEYDHDRNMITRHFYKQTNIDNRAGAGKIYLGV